MQNRPIFSESPISGIKNNPVWTLTIVNLSRILRRGGFKRGVNVLTVILTVKSMIIKRLFGYEQICFSMFIQFRNPTCAKLNQNAQKNRCFHLRILRYTERDDFLS